MPNQRSIMSFFTSSSPSSTDLPKPQSQLQPKPAQQAPPPPPPPNVSRFVPPPSARNGAPAYAPPPGMTRLRQGGSPAPNLDLPPITPAYGRSILQAAGATEDANGNLVFPMSSASSSAAAPNKIVFPRDVHIPDLVSVNGILLPVRYPDSFYKVVADPTRIASLFNRVILGDDGEVVGGVACRLEPTPFVQGAGNGNGLAVYIQSLALLSPYRGRGLMAAVLDSILATVKALNDAAASTLLATTGPVVSLFAHVWTEHDDALQWYASRKFTRQGNAPIEDYYFALRPNTAWVVRRDVVTGSATVGADKGIVSQLAALHTSQNTQGAAATATPPPPAATSTAPPASLARTTTSQSYQNKGPETEWNDMPADMLTSASASIASSRNPSRKVSRVDLGADLAAIQGDENTAPPPPGPSGLLSPALPHGSQASSRSSSSTGRKKRERAYPAAMFQQ
ncbi:hypothetical protein SBRCBS47491_003111 [Sporothrix bragantina]|uniref:N-acetyltransferase domain-containing protein n=1 Tax=Sporothrix bragantina TaxID=671064 RepID=A0ABP0BCF1_9PEZI